MARPKARGLAVELTSHCNQQCSYCFNAWREDGGRSVGALDTTTLLALLDRALTEVDFDHVVLSGGEPLARADLFDVLDVCRRYGKRAHIISNGALVTEAFAQRLEAYRPVSVQITLNAPRAGEHDALVGATSFDRAVAGIAILVRRGFRVTGTVVVTRKNAHLVGDTLGRFLALGVTDVGLSRFSPAGYSARHVAELLPSRADVLTALEQAEPLARDRGMRIDLLLPVPPCVVDPAQFPHLGFGSCPIGTDRQELVLGPRGELRHCLLHPEPIADATASVAASLASPAVTQYRDVTPAFCAPCAERTRCAGGCGAAAASIFGDARALDPFVAQHVDPAFARALAEMRATSGLVPVEGLTRRRLVAGAVATLATAACSKTSGEAKPDGSAPAAPEAAAPIETEAGATTTLPEAGGPQDAAPETGPGDAAPVRPKPRPIPPRPPPPYLGCPSRL
jgi:pyrroloquinoline quinone biosynthesis protein E